MNMKKPRQDDGAFFNDLKNSLEDFVNFPRRIIPGEWSKAGFIL